jgi:hypothetical protein
VAVLPRKFFITNFGVWWLTETENGEYHLSVTRNSTGDNMAIVQRAKTVRTSPCTTADSQPFMTYSRANNQNSLVGCVLVVFGVRLVCHTQLGLYCEFRCVRRRV